MGKAPFWRRPGAADLRGTRRDAPGAEGAPPEEQPLADGLLRLVRGFPGAKERDQIAALVSCATRYDLRDDLVRAVSDTVWAEPSSVERNLDFFDLPSPITWVEYRDAPRRRAEAEGGGAALLSGTRAPSKVGALLCEFPEDPGTTLALVAWRHADGSVHHATAMLCWRAEALRWLSQGAREMFGRGREESWARMMARTDTFVPPGFRTEMEILYRDGGPEAVRQAEDAARRDASSEGLFLLGALLMLRTADAAVEEVSGHPSGRATRRAALAARRPRWWRRDRGFQRNDARAGATLSWVAP